MAASSFVAHYTNQAILITVLVSLPAIIASLGVGLAVALFSATTQIQEQTLSFAPKMVIVYGVLIATGGWVSNILVEFTKHCFSDFASVIQ